MASKPMGMLPAVAAALLLLASGSDALADFERVLQGVYSFYTDDDDEASTQAIVRFDGQGDVTGGQGTIWFLSPGDPGSRLDDMIASLEIDIVDGDYSIDRNGVGEASIVTESAQFGVLELGFAFTVTEVDETGRALRARLTMQQPSLPPLLESDLEPAIITGFIVRIPRALLRKLR